MEKIGIRELRQNASEWLRRVQRGERFEVTDRGRPIALLTPLPPAVDHLERLIAEGLLIPGNGNWRDLGPPVSPTAGHPLPS